MFLICLCLCVCVLSSVFVCLTVLHMTCVNVCVCVSSPISLFLSIRVLFSTNLLASRSPRRPRALTLRYVSASSGRAHLQPIRLQSFPQTPPLCSAWLLPVPLRPQSFPFIENQMIPFPVFVFVSDASFRKGRRRGSSLAADAVLSLCCI